MNDIVNLESYNISMRKSLIDKIFFIDKIDDSQIKVILDFGCADGTLIYFLNSIFPEYKYIGYDNSSVMIERAKEKNMNPHRYANITFTDSLEDIFTIAKEDWDVTDPKSFCLVLSSVIHEVYNYAASPTDIYDFWQFVEESDFGYIVIRDMCLDNIAHRPAFKEDVLKVRGNMPKEVAEFEAIYGSINDNFNLIHFLLKYRYTDNWERELCEDYLKLTTENYIEHFNGYEMIYFDHYILPFLAQVVKNDFDIVIKDYTHVKFIFKRK